MSAGKRRTADQILKGSVTLSSPPLIFDKLMSVLEDPRSGATDLGNVISEDQGLTARILALVNSAFFSLPWKVDSVSAAVRVVGTTQIRDLALATSILSLFSDIPEDLLDEDSFRSHSLACGVTARVLASHRGESNVERFFIAGLLHDIGRAILVINAPVESGAAMAEAHAKRRDLRGCESEHIGCTHDQIGGKLLENWSFPGALQEAVRYHHQPRRATRFPVEAAAIHVADVMAHGLGWGKSGQPHVPEFAPDAWDTLGIPAASLPLIVEEAARQLEAAQNLIPVAA